MIPAETKIYFSKSNLLIPGLIVLGALVYAIVTHNFLAGIIFSIVGVWASYSYLKKATNKQPQIILNEKGVQTSSTQFYQWKDITNEDVIMESTGKNSWRYLVYDYPGGNEKLDIGYLAITRHALENLLRIYRGRNDDQRHKGH